MYAIIGLLTFSSLSQHENAPVRVPTRFRALEVPEERTNTVAEARAHTLGDIMRVYKAATTSAIRGAGRPDFAWQGNYYDHILRNEKDLERIRHYIVNNPARWEEDRLYGKDST